MLKATTLEIVKSTAPVLQEHGETLTRHFYARMFAHNPEVLPFFNTSNQTSGVQQRALASSICAYAANIDNLSALTNAVELVAQKHASLMIKPEHYPIVGKNLLASIREVLGDVATDDIIGAWAEAYGFLADILIGREKQIYEAAAAKTAGWNGFKPFQVMKKQQESSVITSFYLKPEDGAAVPDFLPGQYITLRVPTPDGSTTMRNYSLSNPPGQGYFRISVKRESSANTVIPGGFVSNKLHDDIHVGDTVEVGPPCGEFFLDPAKETSRPLCLLAAGVGITPILSILESALEQSPDREIVFVHACLNEDVQPFKSTIDLLAANHSNLRIHYRYSEQAAKGIKREAVSSTGFVDITLIEQLLSQKDADYYFCGPKPFMEAMHQILAQAMIPAEQIHFEFFGPAREFDAVA